MVWIGARSYSWYLWHWPALVLFAAWRNEPTSTWVAAGVSLAALAVGHIGFTLVEQPIRRWPSLVTSSPRSLAVGLSLSTLCLVGLLVTRPVTQRVDAGGPVVAAIDLPAPAASTSVVALGPTHRRSRWRHRRAATRPCRPTLTQITTSDGADGLAAVLEAAALTNLVPSNLQPPLSEARSILPSVYDLGCHLDYETVVPVICELGDVDSAATAVLIGDSHAAQWVPAFEQLASEAGIRFIPMTKSRCPFAEVRVDVPALNREYTECVTWRDNLVTTLRSMHPDVVIVTQMGPYVPLGVAPAERAHALEDGMTTSLVRFREVADTVVLLGDTPFPVGDPPACLSEHLDDAATCAFTRLDATKLSLPDAEMAAAAAAHVQYVPVVDLACGPTRCPVIVGDLLVYRDPSHLIATYVVWLAPELGRLLGPPWVGPPP